MANWPRAKGGLEDLAFHDPTAGSATQTFTRKGFGTNPNVTVTKLSAANIPLLNAIRTAVASSRTPWDHLVTKNVELALSDAARYKQDAINVVTEGCVLNDNSTTVARRNREVLDTLMATALGQTFVQPWYFPAGELYVERPVADAGSVTFPLYDYSAGTPITPPGLTFIGEPNNSVIRQTTSVGGTEDLCVSLAGGGFTAMGLTFWNKSGNTGRNLVFDDDTIAVLDSTDFRVLDCRFFGGGEGLVFIHASGFLAKNIWVERNIFELQSVRGMQLRNVTDALVRANHFLGGYSDAAILATAGATSEYLLRCLIAQNNLLGTTSTIKINKNPSATYNQPRMRYNGVVNNFLEAGDIVHADLDQQVVDGNILQDGRVQFSMTVNAATFTGMKCRANEQRGSSTDGLEFSCTGGAICHNPQVIGGEYSLNDNHGIEMAAVGSGSAIRGGTIAGVFCNGNGQTSGDGLRIASATNGIVKGVKVVHNDFVDYQTVPTQGYGFQEAGSALLANWNLFGHNHTFGNVTGPWVVVGTNTILDNNIPEV